MAHPPKSYGVWPPIARGPVSPGDFAVEYSTAKEAVEACPFLNAAPL